MSIRTIKRRTVAKLRRTVRIKFRLYGPVAEFLASLSAAEQERVILAALRAAT